MTCSIKTRGVLLFVGVLLSLAACGSEPEIQGPIDRVVVANFFGRVTTEDGQPVADVVVQAEDGPRDGSCPEPEPQIGAQSVSDAAGEYFVSVAQFGLDVDQCVRLWASPPPESGLSADTRVIENVRFAEGDDADNVEVNFVLRPE